MEPEVCSSSRRARKARNHSRFNAAVCQDFRGLQRRVAAADISLISGVSVTCDIFSGGFLKNSCNIAAAIRRSVVLMASRSWPDTDELLLRVGRGDVQARSELLDRHRDRLRRMVAVRLDRRLYPRLDPSDVLQETLVEAAQKLSQYAKDRPIPFYPWLRRLAWENLVRLSEQHLGAERRSVAREQVSLTGLPDESAAQLAGRLASAGLSPDRRVVAAEVRQRLVAAMSQLKDDDRNLLALRYLEQLSIAEVAATVGVSEPVLRTRLTRALDRLTRILDRIQNQDEP